jgi:hypothetical protein
MAKNLDDQFSEAETAKRRDAALSKPLNPPPKAKPTPAPAATKAEIAAQKRADKTVIKRMRKR